MNHAEELSKTNEYYKDLYERERSKNTDLTRRLADTERELNDLRFKMDRLRNSLLWRAIYPFRLVWSHFRNLIRRIRRYGSVSELKKKIKSKIIERRAYKSYGTLSFPSPEEAKAEAGTVFDRKIRFSILVPLYNTPEVFLRQMIDSVVAQTYPDWELCLADGSDDEHAYVKTVVESYNDPRILYEKLSENLGISGNTNKCFEMATGDYIGLFDHDDILHPSALYEYMKAICEKGADYIYCDETTFSGSSIDHMVTLHFKPDFAPDNLRANNYICHFSVFSKDLVKKCGTFRPEFDGSQDHDMILRLTREAENIVHIPRILYYWRSHAGSVASDINAKSYAIDAAKGAVAAHLTACGFKDFTIESTRAFETIFRIRYALTAYPLISIIIPNRDHEQDLRRCINSILERTSYEDYEIIVVENNSATDEIAKYYETIEKHPRIRVVKYEGEFNYSAVNNLGVKNAKGEYLVLLNNDTEVITRNWLEELLMYAQRDDVGATGCMLLYPDYTIQHAGIVLGLGAHRTAGHTHYRMSRENLGYMGRLCYAQNVSAVTGACLMVRKSLYEEAGGLSEDLAVALNDVDLCLKLRKMGLLNIFTPFAELFHYESASRGRDAEEGASAANAQRYEEECKIFRARWKKELEAGDPYFNPNFSLDHSNYVLAGRGKSMVAE